MATAGDATAARPLQLTLYSRADCHLCEEMIAGLERMQPHFSFTLNVVDVDRDLRLVKRFGTEVPVLVHGERELCRHRIDIPGVGAYLSQLREEGTHRRRTE